MITNVLEYLENTKEMYPNKEAFVSENVTYTYLDIYDKSRSIGSYIFRKGFYNRPIFVFLDKDARSIAAFMGVMYSGNFYVPIDVEQPDERIHKLIITSEVPLIITDFKYRERIIKLLAGTESDVVLFNNMLYPEIDETGLAKIRNSHIDMDPAYMIFTSGSTGTPKGVVISHQSVIDYIEWVVDTFNFSADDRLGNQSPFYFDNSVLDIYTTLKTGATMYVIPKICFSFYAKLRDYLNNNRISAIFFVPSVLCNIARLGAFDKNGYVYLKKILFCGEQFPTRYLNEWRKNVPNALYANLYGPTEITDVCIAYIIDRYFDDEEILPIGKACKNTDIVILNDDNCRVVVGEIGEICVRGRSLALGYYGDDEKSKKAFVQNPLNNKYRDIIYRTGDLGQINERGEIVCLGRKDSQIKHMGHRIELGEIEAVALASQKIESCACAYDNNSQSIWLFYTGIAEHDSIIEELKEKIPKYMIPKNYRKMNTLPYNQNGKIDRKLLQDMMGGQ